MKAVVPDPGGLDPKVVRYVLTDGSVALADCSYCQAPVGTLCRGRGGRPTVSVHTARRLAARSVKRRLRAAGVL